MKSIAIGSLAAAFAIGLFIWGFVVGGDVISDSNRTYIQYLQAKAVQPESAQMQCIHWVDKWRTATQFQNDPGMPTFGMYTTLCGKPDSK